MTVSTYNQFLRSLQGFRCDPCAVLVYVDLRDMRALNRIAGAREADGVIQSVINVLRKWNGEGGVSGRLWSNEFVAVRSIDHAQSAVEEASLLRDQLAAIRYRSPLGDNKLTVAMGLTVLRGDVDWPRAINEAAEACEAAKRRGINQILSHNQHGPDAQSLSHTASRVLHFRELMAQGRLSLHPQPIMDIRNGRTRLAKAEFLLRAEDNGGHVPLPAGTIETLEYFGLATELDGFVTQYALEWLAQNEQVLHRMDSISMNLSARSVVDGSFIDGLLREVRNAHLPRGKLCFEITETAAMEHLEVAAEVIGEFKRIGCLFSLDDFGSGLCSFGYLNSLPVDEVKIDGRFIRDVVSSALSQEIVRAIHHVARAAGKKTVAECVDEAPKLEVLRNIGVDYAQGWLFSAALPPERFLKLLEPVAAAA